jgi:adiponectin receptor
MANILLQIVALAVLTLTFLLSPKFQGPKWRTPRLLAFLGTCFSALAPLAHGSVLFGAARFWELGAPFYLLEGVFMLSASYFYHVSRSSLLSLSL